MNVLIGMPAYNGKIELDTVNSLLGCQRARLPISLMGLKHESLIPRGRNTILAYFLHLQEFTHLLWLDADVKISGDDIRRLLEHGKDVIGAAVRLKGVAEDGQPVVNVGGAITTGSNLEEVERIGTAVLLMSRRACQALAQQAVQYPGNILSRVTGLPIITHYDVFRCGVRDGEYFSEDFWVCRDLRELGFSIWVDWSIRTGHWASECYAT